MHLFLHPVPQKHKKQEYTIFKNDHQKYGFTKKRFYVTRDRIVINKGIRHALTF